jgi:type I restriction enzyme R subunit
LWKNRRASKTKLIIFFEHPDRIGEISQYILNNFRQKTHRKQAGGKGFNALFAVSSVDAAKAYYESVIVVYSVT